MRKLLLAGLIVLAACGPGDTKNCSDFDTQVQAQEWFDTYFDKYGDVGRMDGDADGIPCHNLP